EQTCGYRTTEDAEGAAAWPSQRERAICFGQHQAKPADLGERSPCACARSCGRRCGHDVERTHVATATLTADRPAATERTFDADLPRDLRRVVRGEVRFDRGSRALYATDGSNYRQVPIGVVVPRNLD